MRRYLLYLITSILSFIFFSCDDDKNNDLPEKTGIAQSTLLYAVNDNNLAGDLITNKKQIINALQGLPKGMYEFLVYQTIDASTTGLFRAVSGPEAEFTQIITYDRSINSTDPDRLAKVIADSRTVSDVKKRDLFLWGHGHAWSPKSNTKSVANIKEPKYYGGDNYNKDWMDIDEMALAIPDGLYGIIWFDCCYMSNIETVYQLRNKAHEIVAYPTEIIQFGLPYHLILPHILSARPDITKAAEALYNYYKDSYPVTVTVMDMSNIEPLAQICKAIYSEVKVKPNAYELLNYSRSFSKPYYDLRQYARECARLNEKDYLITQLDNAMNAFVTYTRATPKGFSGAPIPAESYSGVSTHYYVDDSSSTSDFYRSLDWFKAVY